MTPQRRVFEENLPTFSIYRYEGLEQDAPLAAVRSMLVAQAHEPFTALWILHAQQALHPHAYFRLVDGSDPSCADCQHRLEAKIATTIQWLRSQA